MINNLIRFWGAMRVRLAACVSVQSSQFWPVHRGTEPSGCGTWWTAGRSKRPSTSLLTVNTPPAGHYTVSADPRLGLISSDGEKNIHTDRGDETDFDTVLKHVLLIINKWRDWTGREQVQISSLFPPTFNLDVKISPTYKLQCMLGNVILLIHFGASLISLFCNWWLTTDDCAHNMRRLHQLFRWRIVLTGSS